MVCVPILPLAMVGKSGLTEKRASLTAGSGVGATMIALTELLTGVFDEVDSIVAVFVSVPASVATP